MVAISNENDQTYARGCYKMIFSNATILTDDGDAEKSRKVRFSNLASNWDKFELFISSPYTASYSREPLSTFLLTSD